MMIPEEVMKKSYRYTVVALLICSAFLLLCACKSKNKDVGDEKSQEEKATVTEIAIATNPYTHEFLPQERFDSAGLTLAIRCPRA